MADTGIFATTAEVQSKAGANASPTSNAEAYINDYMTQVEAYINTYTRVNYSDTYAALDVDVKGLLKEVSSNLAAIYIINYDMSGFASRSEAESMIDTLRDGAMRGLALLRDKKFTDFVDDA
jgi:hypothetical protein